MAGKFIAFILLFAMVLFSARLHALENDTRAYALMQDCLATGLDVVDNGSYERFCIDRYLADTSRPDNEQESARQMHKNH